jgi:endonuclease YncB( thermonuclease family)
MEIVTIVLGVVLVWAISSRVNRSRRESSRYEGRPAQPSQVARPEVASKPIPVKTARAAPFDPSSAHPVPRKTFVEGKAYVVDGDTIKIKGQQIRLFGIDAPEIDHPYGKIAKSALMKLCGGKIVRAEVMAEDDHGRTVARCRLEDSRDLSAEMVKQGLAIDWKKYSGGEYSSIEHPGVRRKKLFLADQRQRGNLKAWQDYDAWRKKKSAKD